MKKPDRLFFFPGPDYPEGPGESPLHYHPIQGTPIGDLVIVYRAAPFLALRILLPNALPEQGEEAFARAGFRRSDCPESIQLAGSILDYLQGDPSAPGPVPWKRLHLDHLTPLQVQVLHATSDIPYGRTASYKAIAEATDRPRAARFVGTTLAINPFPILIPCHRVIRSDASTGEYGGGRPLKRWLLEMESRGKNR